MPVILIPCNRLRLVRHRTGDVPDDVREAVDRHWEYLTTQRQGLFDGPIVAVTALDPDPTDPVLHWEPTTYRHYAARHAVPAVPYARSLYTAVVQPLTDGRILVGQMHTDTATPGRLQLPGGAVEPPPAGEELDLPAVLRQAARELAEETGIDHDPGALHLWGLKTGGTHDDLGVIVIAPPLPHHEAHAHFTTHLARTPNPELTGWYPATTTHDLPPGNRVDYLHPLLTALSAETQRSD
ncbi:MAG: hypothetical protein QG608_3660 [Actinomycetota bacterium]|nr:hypothetical protein [Actinomycetota bacterium]